jgi:putative peptidoglycan lipid II flippase
VWRDPEVRGVLRKAGHAVLQAAFFATELLTILLLTSRVAGGTVALQVALNFYALPIALVATPIGLALLPELSSHLTARRTEEFGRSLREGLLTALFLAIPAALGLLLLADPLARVVASGAMARGDGAGLIAAALSALAVGLVGQTASFVATQGCYARGATLAPLRWMGIQTVVCLLLSALAVATAEGPGLVRAAAAAYACASLVGAGGLVLSTVPVPLSTALPWMGRTVAGAVVMVPVVLWSTHLVEQLVPGRTGALLAVLTGRVAGVTAFAAVQTLLRSPELRWLRAGAARRRVPSAGEELA